MTLEWIHPGIVLVLGAWVLPLLRGRIKRSALVLLPVVALVLCLVATSGTHGVVRVLGLELVLGRVDALMPAASGRIQAAIAAISATAGRANIPLISNAPQPVLQHQSLAAYSVSWRQIGDAAGVMAGKILKGAKVEDMPPWRPTAAPPC